MYTGGTVLKYAYYRASKSLSEVGTYIISAIDPLFHRNTYKWAYDLFEKGCKICNYHRYIVIAVSAVAVTVVVVRHYSLKYYKKTRRKRNLLKPLAASKTFFSEYYSQEYQSTATRKPSEGSDLDTRRKPKRENKMQKNDNLEIITSSEEEYEPADKIFFEVYKTYSASS